MQQLTRGGLNLNIPTTGSQSGSVSETNQPIVPAGRMLPFVLVTALFFLWGIPHNLNDILIRQFMKSFEITRLQAGLVQSAFYLGYFVLAIPAGLVMRRAGYKAGILIGLCLYGAGCFLFWPAAIVAQYWFFLMALFVIASGLAFLETAASPFIAQLGPSENSEQRLNLAQAFNPLGSISAVLIGSRFIFSGIELKPAQISALVAEHRYQDYLRSETLRVIVPYLVIGTVVLIWAVLIARTPFPHTGLDYSQASLAKDHSKPVWARRHFVCAVVAQFLYVGAQVGTWSYLISYVQTYTGLAERSAGFWLTGALAAFTAGRFISTVLLRFVRADHLLGVFAVVNATIAATVALHPGWLGVGCLIVLSFFMSMMFPTIFALGIKGLGTRTKTGGSLIVMSIIGGAALTPMMGKVADTSGIALAYFVPAGCFVLIALYAWLASQPAPGDVDLA
jgi:FHS family L-fucose permease-like MFS transporter